MSHEIILKNILWFFKKENKEEQKPTRQRSLKDLKKVLKKYSNISGFPKRNMPLRSLKKTKKYSKTCGNIL